MRCEEIDYQIHGNDLQVVEVELDPGETVIAEAGAMNWMGDRIAFETKMGDGSAADAGIMGKLLSVGKRALTGKSLFMTHFRNEGRDKQRVAFAAPYPGHIIPVDMAEMGEELLWQKDAFLCAALGTELSIAFNRKCIGPTKAISCAWKAGNMEFQAVVVKIFKSFFQMFSVPDGESERLSIEVLGDLTGVLGRAEKQFQEDQGVLMALLS